MSIRSMVASAALVVKNEPIEPSIALCIPRFDTIAQGILKRALVIVALIVPFARNTCTLLAVKFATQSDPVAVLNASSAGPFVPGLAVLLKSRPGPLPAGKRTSVVPVEFAPKSVTTISPGLSEPGVVEADIPAGVTATP